MLHVRPVHFILHEETISNEERKEELEGKVYTVKKGGIDMCFGSPPIYASVDALWIHTQF